MQRIGEEAVGAARTDGAHLILIDDGAAFRDGRHAIDPHLALSRVDLALRGEFDEHGESYRRRVSLVLRSGRPAQPPRPGDGEWRWAPTRSTPT